VIRFTDALADPDLVIMNESFRFDWSLDSADGATRVTHL
jgi:hypothetical protein